MPLEYKTLWEIQKGKGSKISTECFLCVRGLYMHVFLSFTPYNYPLMYKEPEVQCNKNNLNKIKHLEREEAWI